MNDTKGHVHKLTIKSCDRGRDLDMYLAVDEVDDAVVRLSLATTNEEFKPYILLLDMATIAIAHGAPLSRICNEMKYHQMYPEGQTNNNHSPMVKSIPDFIGRFIERRYIKMKNIPLIKEIVEHRNPGVNPERALDRNGQLYFDMSTDALERILEGLEEE